MLDENKLPSREVRIGWWIGNIKSVYILIVAVRLDKGLTLFLR
jgi:hypothetical protein